MRLWHGRRGARRVGAPGAGAVGRQAAGAGLCLAAGCAGTLASRRRALARGIALGAWRAHCAGRSGARMSAQARAGRRSRQADAGTDVGARRWGT